MKEQGRMIQMKGMPLALLLVTVIVVLLAGCASTNMQTSSQTTQSEKTTATTAPVTVAPAAQEGTSEAVEEEMDEITRAYTEGRYIEVIRLYEQALSDPSASITPKMKDHYSASFGKYVEAALEKAQNVFGQEKDYDAAVLVLQSFLSQAEGISKITGPLEKAVAEYTTSKYADLMNEAYQAGEYLQALQVYNEAVYYGVEITAEMVQRRSDSMDQYINAAIAEAEEAIQNKGDYDTAISTLRNYSTFPAVEGENPYQVIIHRLGEKCDEYLVAKYEQIIDKAFHAGEYLQVAREYESALAEWVQTTEQMEQQYEDSVSEYVKNILDKAKTAFGSNKDYNAAMTLIHEALADSYDIDIISTQLEAALGEYAAYTPVRLSSLEPTQKTQYIELATNRTDPSFTKDVNGTQYDWETVMYRSQNDVPKNGEDAFILYNLNYQYSTFSGTVYRPYDSLSCGFTWGEDKSGVIKIYGDDQLLYESPRITQDTYNAYSFTLNVSGVRNLKIVMIGAWGEEYSFAIGVYFYHPKVCLGDLMLQK